jgi:hypothetical protein
LGTHDIEHEMMTFPGHTHEATTGNQSGVCVDYKIGAKTSYILFHVRLTLIMLLLKR